MPRYPTPECRIFQDFTTGCVGFSVRFPGHRPHHCIDTFNTVEGALAWVDPHQERIWEETSDADESALLISKGYRQGSVAQRMMK